MKEEVLKIPEELLKDLDIERQEELLDIFLEGLKRVKIRRALKKYQDGLISFGRASELTGLREDELSMEAYALGIEPPYTAHVLKEESE